MPHRSAAQMYRAARKSDALLTGAPLPTLFYFALPIILGNIFQQLYSIVDAIVVGKFLGDLPLAGISVAAPIVDVANALVIGGTIGIGVLLGAAPARAGHGGGRLPRGGGLSAAGVRGIDLLLPLQLLRLHAALVRQLAHTVRHSARLVHAPRAARRAVCRRACLGHPRRGVLYGAVPSVFGGVVHSVRRAALPAADAQAQRAAL